MVRRIFCPTQGILHWEEKHASVFRRHTRAAHSFLYGSSGLKSFYWILVIVGAADIDALGSGAGAEGALDGVDGVLDGVDGALDGVDGALDGAAHVHDGFEDFRF
ncbi:MAG: hypothetical protein GY822_04355 [Deltaproteobacteria bacterium]|nr:hypothetical protein [Deltaproteobacteria bacterium]